MKAIILAAGSGKRLGKYTEDLPKGMLNFAGKSLIERQVETLRACGINNIVIIRGYMAEKIQIPGVKYYQNLDYDTTNMVYTLFCAEEELNDDVLVCYGDILYENRVVRDIINSDANIGVTADDSYLEYWKARLDNSKEDTESFVIKDNKVIELGNPNCGLDEAKVRYVGLIRFSKKGIEALKSVYHENRDKFWDKDEPWLNSKSFKKAYMTDMIQSLINDGYVVNPIIISNGWLEFDTVEDYERAKRWKENGTLGKYYKLES